jgi:hypothetical protein
MSSKAKKSRLQLEGGFRTDGERKARSEVARIFSHCADDLETKLDNFPKYARRQTVTRFLALYEVFKRVLPVKGSIVECGVYRGFGLMTWANLSAVLEPNNLTRRIYGFDTFEGFDRISNSDRSKHFRPKEGQLSASSYEELQNLIKAYDSNRFLGHMEKVHLIKGDVTKTVPEFIGENKHLVVSLLFLDLDLYEPTKVAIDHFAPRIPKGGVIAFDELDNPLWPGETMALLETLGIAKMRIERLDFDPYIGFAVIQ